MAYKVFTNGSVLNASEINDNLMNQSVIVFSNSTARSAAITSPIEGMITYLEDTAAYESYDGAAWVAFGASVEPGLTLLDVTNYSAVASQSINDVFSADYDAYKIINTISSASASTTLKFRFRVGGADNTDNLYTWGAYYVGAFASNAAGNSNNGTATFFEIGGHNTTLGGYGVCEIDSPFQAEVSRFTNLSLGQSLYVAGGGFRDVDSFTGFTIFPNTGTITGTVSTYGYRKV